MEVIDLDIIVYTHPGCPGGERAVQYFVARGIPVCVRDVFQSQAAMEEFRALGCIGTPVILVDREKFVGFDECRIERALVARGLSNGA